MGAGIVAAIGIIEALGIGAALFLISKKKKDALGSSLGLLENAKKERSELLAEVESLVRNMVPPDVVGSKGATLLGLRESLKVERGRITITQAELETVESRLRELEEIERELEASGVETKEELKILSKKERDLAQKNDALKTQISDSLKQYDELVTELQLSAEIQAEVDKMRTELLNSQERIDLLLTQIEDGNEQYFRLKKRYDALDIEYAQLYEKFAEAEAATNSEKT